MPVCPYYGFFTPRDANYSVAVCITGSLVNVKLGAQILFGRSSVNKWQHSAPWDIELDPCWPSATHMVQETSH